MDIILAFVGSLIIIFSAYGLGHYFGYGKGEADTLERVKHIRWLESLGYTAESYKEHQKGEKGNPVSGDLITGDGEFILRLLYSMANVYKCPSSYEDAWEKLRDLGLIEYRTAFGGGFRPTLEGYQELERIFKVFPRSQIGQNLERYSKKMGLDARHI